MLVTTHGYELQGGSVMLELDADHELDETQREALEQAVAICGRSAHDAAADRLADAFDIAIGELGGEKNICAG